MGKGSKSRVKDKKRYDDNYDKIFDKQMARAKRGYDLETASRCGRKIPWQTFKRKELEECTTLN
jgi:hypothetical protein